MESIFEKRIRIIPRLDVKGRNVVKGVHLEGLRVLGSPSDFAAAYYQEGADEIIYMDSVASLYGRNNLKDIVSRAAEHIFIPMTVGGGIRSIDDVRDLLKAGADKVAINTAIFSNPTLVSEVAQRFGSQCMVVSIDVVKNNQGRYECLTDNARESTGVDLMDWVQKVESLGAGEILLTSVDREGTGRGFDIELTRMVSEQVSIPVVACGGAGSSEHIVSVIEKGKADAVSSASIFHYDLISRLRQSSSEEGNTDFLKSSVNNNREYMRRGIKPTTISQLKLDLISRGINVRYSD